MMNNWIGPEGLGLIHWVSFAVMAAIVLYPIGRILNRMGISPFWSVIAFIPLFNIVGLWILAFRDWPHARKDGR